MDTGELSIESWLSQLASRVPSPGGGAAAALSASISAALLGMVAQYTTGGKWSDREARMQEIDVELSNLRCAAVDLADADTAAFSAVSAAYKLPKNTQAEKDERTAAIQQALVGAAVPPVEVGSVAIRIVAIAEELVSSGNPNVVSDVAVATATARASLEAAIVNVEINRQQIRDEAEIDKLSAAVGDMEAAIRAADVVTAAVRKRVS